MSIFSKEYKSSRTRFSFFVAVDITKYLTDKLSLCLHEIVLDFFRDFGNERTDFELSWKERRGL